MEGEGDVWKVRVTCERVRVKCGRVRVMCGG